MRWVVQFPSSPIIGTKKCILQLIHKVWSSMGNQIIPEQAFQPTYANTKSIPAFFYNMKKVPTTFLKPGRLHFI